MNLGQFVCFFFLEIDIYADIFTLIIVVKIKLPHISYHSAISGDAFVREVDDEILRVNEIEEKRVKYMTYEMKLEEEREFGREEGRAEGENKLARLISCLLSSGKADNVEMTVKDIDKRQ